MLLKSVRERSKNRSKRPEVARDSLALSAEEITPELLKIRDEVAAFYGKKWAYTRDTYLPMLRTAARLEGRTPLKEAQELAKGSIEECMGLLAALFLAVAAEILEEEAKL